MFSSTFLIESQNDFWSKIQNTFYLFSVNRSLSLSLFKYQPPLSLNLSLSLLSQSLPLSLSLPLYLSFPLSMSLPLPLSLSLPLSLNLLLNLSLPLYCLALHLCPSLYLCFSLYLCLSLYLCINLYSYLRYLCISLFICLSLSLHPCLSPIFLLSRGLEGRELDAPPLPGDESLGRQNRTVHWLSPGQLEQDPGLNLEEGKPNQHVFLR